MTKTPEETRGYIYEYKSRELDEVNKESQRLFDLGNDADMKLGAQLLTLSSALFAVIGGFVINKAPINNNYIKLLIILAVFSLLVSLAAGLKNLQDVSDFWSFHGKRKHKEGRIILDDGSKSYEDLVAFRARLESYRGETVKSSDIKARIVQITSFAISVCLLFVLIIIKIVA